MLGRYSSILFWTPHCSAVSCSPSYVIDATRQGNKARYMRQSADANCQSQKWVAADNQPRAFMLALRDIAAGEELTFDSYKQCSLGGHVRSAMHWLSPPCTLYSIDETTEMMPN